MLQFLCLFVVGVIQDSIHTAYVRAVADRRRVTAAFLSGLITVLAYTVFWEILERQAGLAGVIALATGNFFGTLMTASGATEPPSP